MGMGLGTRQQESGTEQRTVSFKRAGRCGQQGLCGIPFSLALSFLLFFFLFWDHWKAIYPCVVRFDSWGGFFFVASHTCFLWCSVIFSLYIFFEIEKSLDLALN